MSVKHLQLGGDGRPANVVTHVLNGATAPPRPGIWPEGRSFVTVTPSSPEQEQDGYWIDGTYDVETETFTPAVRTAPVKMISKADVIGALTPAQWAEMQQYHPAATGTSPSGTAYNDPDVFWAISVFQSATKDFALDDPRIASILGMLVQKGVLSDWDVIDLQAALAAAAR